jgi:hypothetical protein
MFSGYTDDGKSWNLRNFNNNLPIYKASHQVSYCHSPRRSQPQEFQISHKYVTLFLHNSKSEAQTHNTAIKYQHKVRKSG